MKKGLLIFVILCSAVYADFCPPLPAPAGNTETVSTASELTDAIDSVPPGTTILVQDGTYNVRDIAMNTPNITLRSVSGNRDAVVLDGQYTGGSVINVRADHITIADLTIKRSWYHPIHVGGGGNYARLYNLKIIDGREQFIKVNPSGGEYNDFGEIACSHFELTTEGRQYIHEHPTPGFQCYTGGPDLHQTWGWTVRDNYFKDIHCTNGGLAEHAVHFWNSNRDSVVERNTIINCARGIGFGLGSSGGDRIYPDNPLEGSGFSAGQVEHISGIIRNNMIFSDTSQYDTGIGLEAAWNVTVAHNTIYGKAGNSWNSAIDTRFAASNPILVNNLYYPKTTVRNGGNPTETDNVLAAADMFIDMDAGELHLAGGASAIGQGTPGYASVDIDGEYRDSNPDVGADESATSIHVSAIGSDTSDCGTLHQPCRTVNQALTKVYSGDTIYLAPGNYGTEQGKIYLNDAARQQGISITSLDSSNRPVLTGDDSIRVTIQVGSPSIDIDGVTVSNLRIRASKSGYDTWQPIVDLYGEGHTVENCELSHGGGGINIREKNITIRRNHIHHLGTPFRDSHGISWTSSSNYPTGWHDLIMIENNTIEYTSGDAIQDTSKDDRQQYIWIRDNIMRHFGEQPIDMKYTWHVRISGNDLSKCCDDSLQAGDPNWFALVHGNDENYASSNWEIWGNVFHDSDYAAIDCQAGKNGGLCENWKIYNNVFHDLMQNPGLDSGAIRLSGTGHQIYHNTFIDINEDSGNNAKVSCVRAECCGDHIINNVFFNCGTDSIDDEGAIDSDGLQGNPTYNYIYPVTCAGGCHTPDSTDVITPDPMISLIDFKLQDNSDLIDAGTDVSITLDYFSNPRPIGSGFDIGAHEYQGNCEAMTLQELAQIIEDWKNGLNTIEGVMQSIRGWKDGC